MGRDPYKSSLQALDQARARAGVEDVRRFIQSVPALLSAYRAGADGLQRVYVDPACRGAWAMGKRDANVGR